MIFIYIYRKKEGSFLMANINEKRLKYLEFVNRENNFRHLRYEEEIRPYLYMKAGDPRALDAYRQLIDSPLVGHLSITKPEISLCLCSNSDHPLCDRRRHGSGDSL